MLRSILPVIALLVLALPAAADGWRPYDNAEQGVRAEFPTAPEVNRQDRTTDAGPTSVIIAQAVGLDGGDYYAVSAATFPIDPVEPTRAATAADSAGESAVKQVGATILRSDRIQVDGVAGREIVARASDASGSYMIYFRILFKGSTLYQAVVIDSGAPGEADALRFVRSLRITR